MTPLQPGPLSPGMVSLLKAGRSVLRRFQSGELAIVAGRHKRRFTYELLCGEFGGRGFPDDFDYIGELADPAEPKGWITAPPGGWGSNPVGDRRIEIETADGTREIGCAADFDWTGEHLSIIAFRLVDEATGESAEYRDAVRAANKLTDDEIWGSSAAPIPTEPVADRWADLERLAKTATPGPWEAVEADSLRYTSVVQFRYRSGEPGSVALVGQNDAIVGDNDLDRQNDTAAFIAAANPSTVLELIAAARAKEAGE